MSHDFKPTGYTSLSPYLMVTDAPRVLEFLAAAFDAVELRRMTADDGTIRHVEVRIDDSVVMLSEARDPYPAFSAWLHLYVPDVDASYHRALAAGGTSIQAPTQADGDPDRRGGVADSSGNQWWISTQTA